MSVRALNVAEKPSVAKELTRILSNGRYQTVKFVYSFDEDAPLRKIEIKIINIFWINIYLEKGTLEVQQYFRVSVRHQGNEMRHGDHIRYGSRDGDRLP